MNVVLKKSHRCPNIRRLIILITCRLPLPAHFYDSREKCSVLICVLPAEALVLAVTLSDCVGRPSNGIPSDGEAILTRVTLTPGSVERAGDCGPACFAPLLASCVGDAMPLNRLVCAPVAGTQG